MPTDAVFKAMNLLHRTAIRVTGGRWGWRIAGVDTVALTTTGRTSGRPRTVMLNGFDDVAGAIAVVASRGGDDRQPEWFLNLTTLPTATVSRNGAAPAPVRAHIVAEPQRTELYERIAARHPSYAGYQKRSARVIPVVLLRPLEDS